MLWKLSVQKSEHYKKTKFLTQKTWPPRWPWFATTDHEPRAAMQVTWYISAGTGKNSYKPTSSESWKSTWFELSALFFFKLVSIVTLLWMFYAFLDSTGSEPLRLTDSADLAYLFKFRCTFENWLQCLISMNFGRFRVVRLVIYFMFSC